MAYELIIHGTTCQPERLELAQLGFSPRKTHTRQSTDGVRVIGTYAPKDLVPHRDFPFKEPIVLPDGKVIDDPGRKIEYTL